MVPAVPDLMPALPEIVLAIGALALLMLGVFAGERAVAMVDRLAIAVILIALALVATGSGEASTFDGAFVVDAFSRMMKLLVLIGSGAALIMSIRYFEAEGTRRFELPVLILIAATGMMVMISANDLIALYLGLELQSLAAYVIASINRDNARSSEAGLKYFVLGALSSGMLLYGCSLVYGFTGTVSFPGIAAAIGGEASLGLIFGLVFVLAGLAFKISAVPFHMWTPDVYEGAPTPVTAFFAGAPKIAAMALTLRVVTTAFPGIVAEWQQIVIFLAVASMAIGSFAAIGQRNIKRLMAYSSIGHIGFALVGLAAGSEEGVRGVIIYLAIYLPTTIGTFALILSMRRDGRYVETIDDLAGLSRSHPAMALALAALMFSLAGVPPLAGFFAKFYVFSAAVAAGLAPLAVIGVLLSAVGAFYYLRIVKIAYFDEPAPAFAPMPGELRTMLAVSMVVTLFFAVWPTLITDAATAAAAALF